MVLASCRFGLMVPGSSFDPGGGPQDSAAAARVRHSVREPNIGVVVFLTHKREQAEAILDAQGVWRCPKLPVLDRVLNALHGPTMHAKADMPIGHAELIRVAAWLKGVVRFQPSRPDNDLWYDERGLSSED